MAEGSRIRLAVTLECNRDTIGGTVDDDTGDVVEFSGWLELMSAFDTICARAGDVPHSSEDPRSRDRH